MNQITYKQRGSSFEVRIKASHPKFTIFFLLTWFSFWAFIGVNAISDLTKVKANDGKWFLMFWLVCWAFGGIAAIYGLLWTIYGLEIAKIETGMLTLKRNLFGYGPSKSFTIGQIQNLRASGYFGPLTRGWRKMSLRGWKAGVIAFDYQGETYRFGTSLTEPEAVEVTEKLKFYL